MIQLPIAAQWFLGIVSVVTAFAVLIRTLRPVIKLVARLDDALPILFKIADEFNPAEGRSLSDRLKHLEDSLEETRSICEHVQKVLDAG